MEPPYTKLLSRRFYESMEARDPHDRGMWNILLSLEWKERLGKRSPLGKVLEFANSVRWLLRNPTAIFRGVRDVDHEISEDGWYCYTGIPPHAYNHQTAERVRPWPNEVMMVLVTDERVYAHAEWVDCDPRDDKLPINFDTRFVERIYDV